MVQANYNCSQSALYQVGTNVLSSLSDNLADFTLFKVKYTATYVTDARDAITAAENLPDFQARQAQSEVEYINLGIALTDCCNYWQNLKRYIIAAYPGLEQKPRLEEAGSNYYERAVAKNWDAARAMLIAANNFLINHNVALTAAQNMPPAFTATFDTAQSTFLTQLTAFQQSEEDIKINTANKINANNAIYATISEICLDGQQIFRNNQAMKDQFVFNTVLEIVSGTGTTGFKGYITDSVTGNPIAGAIVSASPNGKSATTDPTGYYDIKQMSAGTYNVNITAAGYQPFNNPAYQVDSGIQHNLSIQLLPV